MTELLNTLTAEAIERELRRHFGLDCRIERVSLVGNNRSKTAIVIHLVHRAIQQRIFIDITDHNQSDYLSLAQYVVDEVYNVL